MTWEGGAWSVNSWG